MDLVLVLMTGFLGCSAGGSGRGKMGETSGVRGMMRMCFDEGGGMFTTQSFKSAEAKLSTCGQKVKTRPGLNALIIVILCQTKHTQGEL